MIKIKVCGITSVDDALAAVDANCNWIGLNFVPRSPRCLNLEAAEEIASAIPKEIKKIAVFEDATVDQVIQIKDRLDIEFVQFHGSESENWCRQFRFPYIKALSIQAVVARRNRWEPYPSAEALLIDSSVAGKSGGTGIAFDWNNWPSGLHKSMILAGGLNPDNVAAAIQACDPDAVDVASGVESRTGKKEFELMKKFVEEVRNVEQNKSPV